MDPRLKAKQMEESYIIEELENTILQYEQTLHKLNFEKTDLEKRYSFHFTNNYFETVKKNFKL